MGRNRLPERIKQIRGTDRPDRKLKEQSEFIKKLPAASIFFEGEGFETVRKIYKTIGASLVVGKVLTQTNLPQFVAYCIEIGTYMDASKSMSTLQSRIEATKSGRTFPSGMNSIANSALKNALNLGREFGFTPASVGRIQSQIEKPKDDEFEKYLNS